MGEDVRREKKDRWRGMAGREEQNETMTERARGWSKRLRKQFSRKRTL